MAISLVLLRDVLLTFAIGRLGTHKYRVIIEHPHGPCDTAFEMVLK